MGNARRFTALLVAGALVCSLGMLVGCGATGEETSGSAGATEDVGVFPVTVTDDAGREVTIEAQPERIVSLAPANTEIVFAMGLIDKLVGVTSFDDYPAEVEDIPAVGDFVGPNVEAIAALEPELILATTGVQADVVEQLEASGAVVLAIDPLTLDGLYESIEMVGAATGAVGEAELVVENMQEKVDEVASAVSDETPVTCFVEIAQDPLFTTGSGTLMAELIVLAGGTNVVEEEGWVAYSVEQLLEDDPAVYMATMGSMSDPALLAERPGYEDLSAVREQRVHTLTDNLVSRPGPRIVEGLEEIAIALHPESFGEAQ